MSTNNPADVSANDRDSALKQQLLLSVIRDLEGVERLQQMQSGLLREVIRVVKQIRTA